MPLVFGAHDIEHNNAVALKWSYLEKPTKSRFPRRHRPELDYA
jgi:hypothetical protein